MADHRDEEGTVRRIAEAATARGLRVAVAESLTSGLLAGMIGAGPHAEDWFAGGVVAYQSHVKERLLGLASDVDPCSAECAEQLARGVRRLLQVDVAVSTTGVGGPEPDNGHPPGTVYLGWADDSGAASVLFSFHGSPEEVLAQAVAEATRILARLLTDRPRALRRATSGDPLASSRTRGHRGA